MHNFILLVLVLLFIYILFFTQQEHLTFWGNGWVWGKDKRVVDNPILGTEWLDTPKQKFAGLGNFASDKVRCPLSNGTCMYKPKPHHEKCVVTTDCDYKNKCIVRCI